MLFLFFQPSFLPVLFLPAPQKTTRLYGTVDSVAGKNPAPVSHTQEPYFFLQFFATKKTCINDDWSTYNIRIYIYTYLYITYPPLRNTWFFHQDRLIPRGGNGTGGTLRVGGRLRMAIHWSLCHRGMRRIIQEIPSSNQVGNDLGNVSCAFLSSSGWVVDVDQDYSFSKEFISNIYIYMYNEL